MYYGRSFKVKSEDRLWDQSDCINLHSGSLIESYYERLSQIVCTLIPCILLTGRDAGVELHSFRPAIDEQNLDRRAEFVGLQ